MEFSGIVSKKAEFVLAALRAVFSAVSCSSLACSFSFFIFKYLEFSSLFLSNFLKD